MLFPTVIALNRKEQIHHQIKFSRLELSAMKKGLDFIILKNFNKQSSQFKRQYRKNTDKMDTDEIDNASWLKPLISPIVQAKASSLKRALQHNAV
jgi:hypothetical protein